MDNCNYISNTICHLYKCKLHWISSWLVVSCSITIIFITKIILSQFFYTDSGNNSADSAICAMLLPDMPDFPLYELSCIVFFLIPMFVMLAVYIRMGLKIRKSAKNKLNCDGEYSAHLDSQQVQSRTSIIRMLSKFFTILLTFFYHLISRLNLYNKLERKIFNKVNVFLQNISQSQRIIFL